MEKTSTKPVISIVIPAYNRSKVLNITLDKLASQDIDPKRYEVIVVDDGSTDGLFQMVSGKIPHMPYTLRLFHHENHGPGFTQNRGIIESRGNLILILPNDIWVTKGLIRKHLQTHKQNPQNYVAVMGKVTQSPDLESTVLHKYWDRFSCFQFEEKTEVEGIFFHACNVSLKRKFLIDSGFFKTKLGASNEDAELGYRLQCRGMKLLYNREAKAFHHHEETLVSLCQRAYEEGSNIEMLDDVPESVLHPFLKILNWKLNPMNSLRLLPFTIIRICLFNRGFFNFLWMPLLRRVDYSPLARLIASRNMYHAVYGYWFRLGMRQARHRNRITSKGP